MHHEFYASDRQIFVVDIEAVKSEHLDSSIACYTNVSVQKDCKITIRPHLQPIEHAVLRRSNDCSARANQLELQSPPLLRAALHSGFSITIYLPGTSRGANPTRDVLHEQFAAVGF